VVVVVVVVVLLGLWIEKRPSGRETSRRVVEEHWFAWVDRPCLCTTTAEAEASGGMVGRGVREGRRDGG
jgi:hypothetical protein